jgi:hypothetical protein
MVPYTIVGQGYVVDTGSGPPPSAGILSINGDTTQAQHITSTTLTISTSAGTTTINTSTALPSRVVVVPTTTYTIPSGFPDGTVFLVKDATSTLYHITLPDATAEGNKILNIKLQSNLASIDVLPFGTQTIETATGVTGILPPVTGSQYPNITLMAHGTDWFFK